MKAPIRITIPLSGTTITTGLTLLALMLSACNKNPEKTSLNKDLGDAVDQSIADSQFEELTITELRPVQLSEIFERTREAFSLGDTKKTIEQVKTVASFFAREAETRSDDTQAAFDDYSKELITLASLLETEGLVLEEDLDEIFANAHLILALDRANNAQTAAKKNLREKVGENTQAAIDHAKQALRRTGKRATAEMSRAGDAIERAVTSIDDGAELAKEKAISAANKTRDYTLSTTQLVKEKIKEGKESTTRKNQDVIGKLIERTGKSVEKMGRQMKNTGTKIKPETADPENHDKSTTK